MTCIPSPSTSRLVPPPRVLKTLPRLPESTVGQRQPNTSGKRMIAASRSFRTGMAASVAPARVPSRVAAVQYGERPLALEGSKEQVEGGEEEHGARGEGPEQRDLRAVRRARGRERHAGHDEVRVLRRAPPEDDERDLGRRGGAREPQAAPEQGGERDDGRRPRREVEGGGEGAPGEAGEHERRLPPREHGRERRGEE